MGAGKGEVSHYVATVAPGRVLFEVDGIGRKELDQTFKNLASKLPVKTKVEVR